MPTMPQAFVTKRYGASYAVSIGGLSQTLPDNGLSEILSFNLGPLMTGSYTLSITPTSDTGITGTPTTQDVTIGGAPNAPGVPIYVSGTSAATVISFTASTTAGATYPIYMPQEIGGPTFIESPATTHIAGSGTISVTLPSRTAQAGDMTIFVTSLSGGVESGYQKVLISYNADGTVVSAAPNVPGLSFQNIPVSSGRNINVAYIYDSTNEAATPTKIQTQIMKYETQVTTTQSEQNIAAFSGNIARANLTIASGSDGWFIVQARTKSAAGKYSDWGNWIGPVWSSNEVISGISGLTVNVTG